MTDPPPPPPPSITASSATKKKRALRYVEARRTGTCAFADRIAALSLQHYRHHVLKEEDAASTVLQTCLATIIAAFATDQIQEGEEGEKGEGQTQQQQQQLLLCAMGVGTKFLSQEVLTTEIATTTENDDNHHLLYGTRIRDAHAEVLVRRAFQRYLGMCMEQMEEKKTHAADLSTTTTATTSIPVPPLYSILEPVPSNDDDDNGETPVLYRLRPNVTLHMYCSSTPCGNSTIKKFATLHKETYDAALSAHEWPRQEHPPIPLHSIPLGQCALLLKRDRQRSNEEEASSTKTTTTTDETLRSTSHPVHKKERSTWPLYSTTDWCPPGTTPTWSGQGACHSCSDKLARWNCLGLQGAWLSSLLSSLYLTTLTVGRKFSQHTCRRAVCCRLQRPKPPRRGDTTSSGDSYTLHHVVVMGTGVYMDEDGVHDWSAALEEGMTTTAVRFHSSRSFCSWLRPDTSPTPQYTVECIDGSTGRLYGAPDVAVAEYDADRGRSLVSSAALMELYWRIQTRRSRSFPPRPRTLTQVRRRKRLLAPAYERAKRQLLTRHPVMREWQRRRVDSIDDDDNHAPLVLDAAAVRVDHDD